MINTPLSTVYQSSSPFRDVFSTIIRTAATRENHLTLKAAWLDTRLGSMIAIADENALYLLEFIDRRSLENEVIGLQKKLKAAIIPGETTIIKSIKSEIADYFNKGKFIFKTPILLMGSPFQKSVWEELKKIPSGETRSYLNIAKSLNRPTACRAVARANATNQLAIIVPCHRVINTSGELGGYAAGVARKQWLLEHEKNK
jgi:AraC family transcriptional regulator of adaptative response/methylated-DNA-[protein]-cysteine methyltransferase